MIFLSDIDIQRITVKVLISICVPLLIAVSIVWGRKESIVSGYLKQIEYSKGFKTLSSLFMLLFFWGLIYGLSTANEIGEDVVIKLSMIFGPLIIPLFLEAQFVKITWDNQNIYTKSPWRKSRIIPLSSVTKSDYSYSLNWYRIYTQDHGIIRLHQFAYGISHLFDFLPVENPEHLSN